MKTKNLLPALLLVILLASCQSGQEQRRDYYNPITNYFVPGGSIIIPVHILNGQYPSFYLPDFVNYPDDRSKFNLRGNVRRVITKESQNGFGTDMSFDINGNILVHHFFMDEKRRYGERELFERDGNGQLVAIRNQRTNRTLDDYKYSGNRLVQRENGGYIRNFTYDEKGNPLKITTIEKTRDRQPYHLYATFDERGNIDTLRWARPFVYSVLSAKGATATCKYDEKDRLTSLNILYIITDNRLYDELTGAYTFEYNEQNEIAKRIFKLITPEQEVIVNEEKSCTYDFDEHGNWTCLYETLTSNMEPTKTTRMKREITYFSEEEVQQAAQAEEEMKKKPFIGHWYFNDKEEFGEDENILLSGELVLNLYEGFVPDGYTKKVPGIIFSVSDPSTGMEQSGSHAIYDYKIKGNKAEIKYRGYHSEEERTATLIYNPKDKTMTFEDGEILSSPHTDYPSGYEKFDLEPQEGIYQYYSRSTVMERE